MNDGKKKNNNFIILKLYVQINITNLKQYFVKACTKFCAFYFKN